MPERGEKRREERRDERREERRAERDGFLSKWLDKLDNCLKDEDSCFGSFFGTLEKNTGVGRSKIVVGACIFLGLYLIVGYGKEFICNLVGFAYPAYASIKAIESHDKDDDTKWLTYWVVFSLFSVVESLTDIFLSWIPFYFLIKCVFLLFCMAPIKRNGSTIIYNRIIRPIFLRHEKDIDEGIDTATKAGMDVLNQAGSAATGLVGSADIGLLAETNDESKKTE